MINRTEKDIIKNWKGSITTPLVSVCTITYNHEKFIEDTLDSFLMQETEFPFEIVIDDDCSLDGTAGVIEKYIEKYPNIINANLRQKNVGAMTNFIDNMGRANGKYIALCEGDDYWTDSLKLQQQIDFLEHNNEYIITYTAVYAFNEEGIIKDYKGGAKKDLEAIELQKATSLNTLTVCFRNILKEFPPEFQCTKLGDKFLWSLLGEFGKGKFLENIKPAKYRVHKGGIFSQKNVKTQYEMAYLTSFSLYMYYLRINNKLMSDYFHKDSLYRSLLIYGDLYHFKILIKNIVSSNIFYTIYTFFKKRIVNFYDS